MSATRSTHPLLLKYLSQLDHHPLRTKAITTGIFPLNLALVLIATNSLPGILCFLQEVLGSNLSGTPANVPKGASAMVRSLQSVHLNVKAIKMAIYGFLVAAPTNHILVGLLQKAFAGKTSSRARVMRILAHSLFVSPIQAAGNSIIHINIFSPFLLKQISPPPSIPCLYGRDERGNFT
jgi:peroxisomal membrane protein 2